MIQMGQSKHKSSNWKDYNQALVKRGSLTVWMDEQAIKDWLSRAYLRGESTLT